MDRNLSYFGTRISKTSPSRCRTERKRRTSCGRGAAGRQGAAVIPAPPVAIGCSSDLHGCPCGYYSDPTRECTCSEGTVSRYQKRISGPLLDRVDIFIEVPRVDYEKLSSSAPAEQSSEVRDRVERTRSIQLRRFIDSRLVCNAEMTPTEVREHCQQRLDEQAQGLLRLAMTQLGLSARAFHRVLKLARTIADMDASDAILSRHLAEAVQYRQRVRG